MSLAWAGLSYAASPLTLDMPAQSLSVTLNRVARAGSVELAFDRALTDKLRAPRLAGRFTVDQALAAALEATGLGVQRTRDGAYVVNPVSSPPRAKLALPDDGAVSEIMVLGRRNLNTGIRRTRDDIQPYDVALDETIRNAGDTDIESFMRRAMPADAQSASLTQAPAANAASARSQIDLLGLGDHQTLVLVDGRRLPSLPEAVGAGAGFVQADINGVPLAAIERIEVLTATAGALYGPGATGGVVNIVLKRDYEGSEVKLTQGFTEHGGGQTRRIDASVGRSSRDGRGGVAMRFSLAEDQGLAFGQRPYAERAATANGADFLSGLVPRQYVPVGAGVNVVSWSGPLTLKPAFGGAALGSTFTSFPSSGFTSAEAIANAGKADVDLSSDAFGERQSLMTRTDRRSLLVSGRQEVGILEGFFDFLSLDNRGRATVPAGDTVFGPIGPQSPENPFEQAVMVSRSAPGGGTVRNRSFTRRANAGLIVRLPAGWMAESDVSWSRSLVRMRNEARGTDLNATLAILSGKGYGGGPILSPFASEETFLAAYRVYQVGGGSSLSLSDELSDFNLRMSGPLWTLPGGPITMTLSGETFREKAPGGLSAGYDRYTGQATTTPGNRLGLLTRSAYAEWRAPLTSSDAPGPFKSLELQVALRGDAYRTSGPQLNVLTGAGSTMSEAVSKHVVFGRTVGFKTFLTKDVMLRASYSVGHSPPRSDQVQSVVTSTNGYAYLGYDPKREDELLGANGNVTIIDSGSPKLEPETARTFSLGVVLQPQRLAGARVSIDYLRTDKSGEIVPLSSDPAKYVLAHEGRYPSRVARAPLTDSDRANGLTGGAITWLDISDTNAGRSIVETVDISAEYRWRAGSGEAGAYLRGAWQPSYRRRVTLDSAWVETAGFSDGPLRVRAFAGVQWSRGGFKLGLNGQYYASYKVTDSGLPTTELDRTRYLQRERGGHVPAQVYLDAFSAWSIGERTLVQVNVRNLLDAAPPLELAAATGYSTYGDARGRSFEISLTRRF